MDRERGGLEIESGLRLKHVVLVMGMAFSVTLAVVVGKQMSAEAMAVVVGVVCGILAAVPTTVLLLMVLTRSERFGGDGGRGKGEAGRYPPVVVVQGGAPPPQALPPGTAGYWPGPMAAPGSREFRVVGGDELLEDGRY